MSLTDIAKRLESVATTVSIGGRTLLSLDTNPVPSEWDHITKVDPETEKKLPLAFPLYLSHTSAVSVGGSRDVTDRNTEETFDLVTAGPVPAFHEPSAADHVTEKTRENSDFLAVPEVLNGDSEALVGTLGRGLDYVRTDLGPELIEEKLGVSVGNGLIGDRISNFAAAYLMQEAIFEAYIIMNLDSAAAREANVTETDLLTPQQARERALAAEYHLESEIIYLEYSGTFGGDEATAILEAIDDAVSWSRVWYGGGLDSRENVQTVLDAGADAVVVGNVFHDVAEEEAALIEQAREEFDSVPEDLDAWVEETVDIGETGATRYLSTIPDVTNPEQLAVHYLATGVEFALRTDAVGAGLTDPDAVTIERELRTLFEDDTPFGESLDEDAVAHRLAASLLGDQFDVAIDDAFATTHLGVEPR